MNCPEVLEQLEPYVDGELTSDVRGQVEAHLAGCESCSKALEEEKLTWDALDAYSVPETPGVSASKVIHAARSRERRVQWVRLGFGIAAALLIMLAVWQTFGTGVHVDLSPEERQEIVTNLDVLENLEMLESLEVIENMDLLESDLPEILNGSEQG
ncbi:MAG: zf-HC2 domain-containing protein [Planctomycetota bacterium]|nr:zf-HC2 domain-containing protein [Planctomycetota bacterium]